MSHESPHYENGILFLSDEQVRTANTLAEAIIDEFRDDQFAWPVGDGGDMKAVQRILVRNGEVAIVATEARILDSGKKVRFHRYMLNLDSRVLSYKLDLQDTPDDDSSHEELLEDLDGASEAVDEMLFDIGFNHATLQDWDDFLALLSEGKESLAVLHSLSSKIGIPLTELAVRLAWGNSPTEAE